MLQLYKEHQYGTSKLKQSERRALRSGVSVKQLLDQVDELFTSKLGNEIRAVLISLGPSFSRMKEVYLINMEGIGNDTLQHEHVATPGIKAHHVLSRRVITAFMNTTNDRDLNADMADVMAHPSKATSSYKAFISLLLPKSALEENPGHGLLLRHQFSLDEKMRHTRNRPISIRIDCRVVDHSQEALDTNTIEADNLLWTSLQGCGRGFRM